jgi:cobalamin biosynthesis protein CobD/CbiB
LLLERVPLAGDLEHDLHSAEPISAIVGECVPGQQLRPLRRMRNVNDPNASSAERLVAAGVSGVQLEGSARTFSPVAAVGRGAPPAAKRDSSQPGVPLQAA